MIPAVRTAAVLAALLGTLSLAACATKPPPIKWAARPDANLATDLAACSKDAGSVNQRSEEAYSDSRYGAAAAMTGRLDQTDMTSGSVDRMYDAIVFSCMTRKGWTAQ
jgi:hypothetical protein